MAGKVNLNIYHNNVADREKLTTLKVLLALPASIKGARNELNQLLPKN